jgi:rubrerythrin
MSNMHDIEITTRDKLLRAWENSMELVRDFENYSKDIKDDRQAAEAFKRFAEDEGMHANELRQMLHGYQGK